MNKRHILKYYHCKNCNKLLLFRDEIINHLMICQGMSEPYLKGYFEANDIGIKERAKL